MNAVAEPPVPPAAPIDADAPRAPLSTWWVLLVVLLLALYTIMDRQIFALQVEPIRRELGLSDFQFGLVQGLSVALFTAVVGYPIGWLADRYDRRWVLAGSIAVWSGSMAAAGLAQNFEQMFIASALVGAGEAGLLPIAYALIPELFKGGRQRQLANSTLVVGGRLASGLVIALSGWMIFAIDQWRPLLPEAWQALPTWRLAFFVTAAPGLLFVPLILLLPVARRAAVPMTAAAADAAPTPSVLRHLRANRTAFLSFYAGVGTMVFGIGCLTAFAPAIAMRQMGATPLEAGNGMGAATFAATLVGFLIAQVGYRLLERRIGPRLPVALMVAAMVTATALTAAMLSADTPRTLFIGLGVALTAVMAGTLLFPTALQDMTPAPLRARLVSIAIMVNIVLGSLGPAVVGLISDSLKARPDGLQIAACGSAMAAMALAALLLLPVVRRYPATVAAARAEEARQGAAA